MALNAFAPDGSYALLSIIVGQVGATTPSVALPGSGVTILVTNEGPSDAIVTLSVGAAQIAAADLAHGVLIKVGESVPLTRGSNTFLNGVILGGAGSGAALNLASGA